MAEGGTMRERQKILGNLEDLYREAFRKAEAGGSEAEMARLDFGYQRDQLYLEVMLDLRELLAALDAPSSPEDKTTSLLDKAQAFRRLTRLR
jgi:hypothetical protein